MTTVGLLTNRGRDLNRELSPKPNFPISAMVALFWVATGDLVRTAGLGGAFTILALVLLGAEALSTLLLNRNMRWQRTLQPRARIPLFSVLFLAWTVISYFLIGRFPAATQNLAVYLSFVLAIYCGARKASFGTGTTILQALQIAAVFGTLLWMPTIFTTGIGTDGFLVTRGSAAYCATLGLAVAVATPARTRIEKLAPYYFACVPLLTLSRLPLVLSALLIIMIGLRSDRPVIATVVRGLVVAAIVFTVFSVYTPLQERFIDNDGTSLGGFQVGTSGRTTIWAALLDQTSRSTKLFGLGAGASEHFVLQQFGGISQPHNDYLRMYVDFGQIGLVLFVASLIVIAMGAMRRWLIARNSEQAAIHLAALMLILITAAYAYLDNVIVYSFFMTPVGLVVGVSLAMRGRSKEVEAK